jgi:glyceraldehyde 3-phosphate dehydrogenase
MTPRIGINGLGRIGRQVLKIMKEDHAKEFDVVAFNDLGDLPTMAHLFKYDSNYGKFGGSMEVKQDGLVIQGDFIKALSEPDPAKLPWKDLGVDIVIESTGAFTSREKAGKHLAAGAKKVIISAPSKDPDLTIVLGVNEGMYDSKSHHVVSNASCTTNCLAPAAKVVQDSFGIVKGLMTTIHAYTNDQRILDLPHKDLRRARAAGLNIIPTSTGAARAVALSSRASSTATLCGCRPLPSQSWTSWRCWSAPRRPSNCIGLSGRPRLDRWKASWASATSPW